MRLKLGIRFRFIGLVKDVLIFSNLERVRVKFFFSGGVLVFFRLGSSLFHPSAGYFCTHPLCFDSSGLDAIISFKYTPVYFVLIPLKKTGVSLSSSPSAVTEFNSVSKLTFFELGGLIYVSMPSKYYRLKHWKARPINDFICKYILNI